MNLGNRRSWTQCGVSACILLGARWVLSDDLPLLGKLSVTFLGLCAWVLTGHVVDWAQRRRKNAP